MMTFDTSQHAGINFRKVKDVKKKVKDAVDEATAIETTGEVVTEKPPFPADFDEAIAAAAELPAAEPVEPPAEEK